MQNGSFEAGRELEHEPKIVVVLDGPLAARWRARPWSRRSSQHGPGLLPAPAPVAPRAPAPRCRQPPRPRTWPALRLAPHRRVGWTLCEPRPSPSPRRRRRGPRPWPRLPRAAAAAASRRAAPARAAPRSPGKTRARAPCTSRAAPSTLSCCTSGPRSPRGRSPARPRPRAARTPPRAARRRVWPARGHRFGADFSPPSSLPCPRAALKVPCGAME